MSEVLGTPNPGYYKHKRYSGNPTLAKFGARHNLPCGNHWLLGVDFVFEVDFCATSYTGLATIREYNKNLTNDWHELKLHLLKMEHSVWTIPTLDRNAVAAMIGVETINMGDK